MATLTPSELAALLGPCAAPMTDPAPVAPQTTTLRWTSFAEDFARRLTARLRPLIRAASRVTFRDGCTLTVESLGAANDSASVLRFWQSSRSVEPLAIVLSVPLVATFVDRLLGGRSTPDSEEPELHQPLTDVDARLASRLIDAVRQSTDESAATIAALDLTDAPTAPLSFAEAWLPDSSLVRLTFDLRFVQGGGSLDLLLPLEIAKSLADEPNVSEFRPASENNTPKNLPTANSSQRRATVIAQLAPTKLSQSDLNSLSIGDVLLAGPASESPLQVVVDGHPRFLAVPGTLDGRKAIRLTASALR